jgi:catechol 2,3-dioxygenase-like lactoylglutathione lyase family enzyme
VSCACCDEEKPTVSLRSRDDVALCRDCVDWLVSESGATSTPTLPVRDMDEAEAFYVRAGFGVRRWRADDNDPGDGFAFVDADGQSVFDLDAIADLEPASNHAGCYVIVRGADEWYARMRAAGLPVTEFVDQPWRMREYTLTDPSGNNVRIGRPSETD